MCFCFLCLSFSVVFSLGGVVSGEVERENRNPLRSGPAGLRPIPQHQSCAGNRESLSNSQIGSSKKELLILVGL